MKNFRSTWKMIHGLTLIELMIALIISVSLVLAVTKIFIHAKKTYQVQLALSDVTSNSSYANYVLEKIVRVTGYRKAPTDNVYTEFNDLFPCGIIGGTDHDTLPLCKNYVASDNEANGLANDTLLVYFQADSALTQCDNTELPSDAIKNGNIILYRLTVIDNKLRCLTYNVTTSSAIGSEIILIDNVLSFQVLYGLGNTDKAIERYVPISFPSLSTPESRNQIMSIRIGLLLQSSQKNIKRQSDPPETVDILDTKRNYPSEDRVYLLINNTIQIRNNFNTME
jgi:type IV pilus assembly protein PilW